MFIVSAKFDPKKITCWAVALGIALIAVILLVSHFKGASSPGGGRIQVFRLDGLSTSFTGELPTLVVHNSDRPGCVSQVTGVLAGHGMNVATLQLNRGGRGESAVMVIECDQPIPDEVAHEVRALPGILRVTRYTPEQEVAV